MTVAGELRSTGDRLAPEIAAVLDATDGLGFCEVIAESVRPDALPVPLLARGTRPLQSCARSWPRSRP